MNVRYTHSKQRQAKNGNASSCAIPYLTRIVGSLEYIGRSQLYSPLSPLSSAFFGSLSSLSPCKYCFGDCTARSIHSVLKHARIMLPEWDEEHDGDDDEDDWKKRNERGEDCWAACPDRPSLQRGSMERTSSYANGGTRCNFGKDGRGMER